MTSVGPLCYSHTAQPCRGRCCPRLTVTVGWVLGQDQTAHVCPFLKCPLLSSTGTSHGDSAAMLLQLDHGHHAPTDQELCKGRYWRSEILKCVPYERLPVRFQTQCVTSNLSDSIKRHDCGEDEAFPKRLFHHHERVLGCPNLTLRRQENEAEGNWDFLISQHGERLSLVLLRCRRPDGKRSQQWSASTACS